MWRVVRQIRPLFYDGCKEVLSEVCHIDINIGKLKAWSKATAPCPPGIHEFGDDISKSDDPVTSSYTLSMEPQYSPER